MSDNTQLLREYARQAAPWDLPLGMYVVTEDGHFVECNTRLRQILRLPNGGLSHQTMSEFYTDPSERQRLCEKQCALPDGEFLENQEISFTVNGQEVWVRDTCKVVRDPGSRTITGYMGFLTDITEEVRLRRLFDQLPAGVYQSDKDDNIVMVNKAVARMLGYESEEELVHRPMSVLHAEKAFAATLRQRVLSGWSLGGVSVELRHKTGRSVATSVTSTRIDDADGNYAGREGIIVDVSVEAAHREILDAIPVGTYKIVIREDGSEPVVQCNNAFAHIFGYDSADQMLGADFRDRYQDPTSHEEFVKYLLQADAEHRPLIGFPAKVTKLDGRPITVEVNASCLTDNSGDVTGRVGVIRDISNETALWDLKNDVGRTLHVYTSTLIMMQFAVRPVISAMRRAPFGSVQVSDRGQAEAIFSKTADSLKTAIHALLGPAEFLRELNRLLPPSAVDIVKDASQTLADYEFRIPWRDLQIPALRDIASEVLSILSAVRTSEPMATTVADATRAGTDLERLCLLIGLWNVQDRVLEMEYEVRAFREFITFQLRLPDPVSICRLSSLIVSAIRNFQELARSRGIEIQYQNESKGCMVEVRERQVVRAIANLLHNAIKYTWSKPHESPFVKIISRIIGGNVQVQINNYGVPITKDEIERELIFQIGYRGVNSGDRGRLGSGIGLSDARQIAREHNGDVTLTSHRGSPSQRPDDYSGPFTTAATLTLPMHHVEERADEM